MTAAATQPSACTVMRGQASGVPAAWSSRPDAGCTACQKQKWQYQSIEIPKIPRDQLLVLCFAATNMFDYKLLPDQSHQGIKGIKGQSSSPAHPTGLRSGPTFPDIPTHLRIIAPIKQPHHMINASSCHHCLIMQSMPVISLFSHLSKSHT